MITKPCDICQRAQIYFVQNRLHHPRIPMGYSPMECLSVDMKFMPNGLDDFKHLLVATSEITNFLFAIPIKSKATKVIADELSHRVICIFSPTKLLLIDKDSAFHRRSHSVHFNAN